MRASVLAAFVVLTCVGSMACSSTGASTGAGDDDDAGRSYPDGPFGTTPGDVIADAQLVGFVNPAAGATQEQRVPFRLADFYNPTGRGFYADDSPFGGPRPLPRGLLLAVASLWCGASRLEGAEVLPERHAAYGPLGAEVLLVLAEGVPAGEPATPGDLDQWITNVVQAEHPTAVAPSGELREAFGPTNYPDNIIVDMQDMTIVAVEHGAPTDSFWGDLEELLGDVP